MTNMRVPGSSGCAEDEAIYSGTLSRSVHNPPRHCQPDDLYNFEWVEKQIREGNFDALGRASNLAHESILEYFHERRYISIEQVRFILNSLPDCLREPIAVALF
jgi:hypothetical protein